MVRSGESLRGCLVSQSTCRGAMHTNAWLMLVWALEYFWRTACLPLTLSERAKSCLCNLVSSCRTCCNFSAYLHVETHLRSLCVPLWRGGMGETWLNAASLWEREQIPRVTKRRSEGNGNAKRPLDRTIAYGIRRGPLRRHLRDAAICVRCYSWHGQGSCFPDSATLKSHRSQTTCATSPFSPGPLRHGDRSGLMSPGLCEGGELDVAQSNIIVGCIALIRAWIDYGWRKFIDWEGGTSRDW